MHDTRLESIITNSLYCKVGCAMEPGKPQGKRGLNYDHLLI